MKPIIKWQAFLYNHSERRFEFDSKSNFFDINIGDTEFDSEEEAIIAAYSRNPYKDWYIVKLVRFDI